MNNPNNMNNTAFINAMVNALAGNQDAQNKINENETSKSYWQALQQRDSKRGEELANQILQTYGLTQEQAIQQAQQGLSQMAMQYMPMRR